MRAPNIALIIAGLVYIALAILLEYYFYPKE